MRKGFYYSVIITHFHYRDMYCFVTVIVIHCWMNVNIIIIIPAGKLQKAEYILSSLINNSGATGRFLLWHFNSLYCCFYKVNKKQIFVSLNRLLGVPL